MVMTKALPDNDFGTDEARRRAEWLFEQPDPRDRSTRRVRVVQDQVDWYAKRQYIAPSQADALRRWQSDAYLAGLMPSGTGSYGQRIMGGPGGTVGPSPCRPSPPRPCHRLPDGLVPACRPLDRRRGRDGDQRRTLGHDASGGKPARSPRMAAQVCDWPCQALWLRTLTRNFLQAKNL